MMKKRLLVTLLLAGTLVSSCSSPSPEQASLSSGEGEGATFTPSVEPEEVYTVEPEDAGNGEVVSRLPREPVEGESYVSLPGDLYVKTQEGKELPARAKSEVDRRVSRVVAQANPDTVTDDIASVLKDVPESYVVITVTPSVIYGVDPKEKSDGYTVCAVASTSLYSCFYGHDVDTLIDHAMTDSPFPNGKPMVKVVDLTS